MDRLSVVLREKEVGGTIFFLVRFCILMKLHWRNTLVGPQGTPLSAAVVWNLRPCSYIKMYKLHGRRFHNIRAFELVCVAQVSHNSIRGHAHLQAARQLQSLKAFDCKVLRDIHD
jgi:hypothetical protein